MNGGAGATVRAGPQPSSREHDGRVVVIDGALGTQLESRGFDLSDRLWSARLLHTHPDAIEHVHLDYYRAGAESVTTATYQATVDGFRAAGIEPGAARRLIGSSVELARRAGERYRDETGDERPLSVAGSVGPYGAMLADGSEFTGDYDPGADALASFHRPRIEALIQAGADILAFETIPAIREAEVLVALATEYRFPAWLSYSCRDGATTSAGEPIEDAVALGESEWIVAVGVNCTAPRHLPELLAVARAATDRPLIAYPNRGDRWDAEARRWVAAAGDRYDPAAVASWTELGATWLGGCCGTAPDDIADLARLVGSRSD